MKIVMVMVAIIIHASAPNSVVHCAGAHTNIQNVASLMETFVHGTVKSMHDNTVCEKCFGDDVFVLVSYRVCLMRCVTI